MKWFSNISTAVAIFNLVLAPLAQAQSVASMPPTTITANSPAMVDYRYEMDTTRNVVNVIEQGTNAHRLEIPLATKATLRTYKPSSLNEKLALELNRIRSANKAAFSHSLRALPTESFIFFMAMGAVVAGQLILNYSQNPTAMEQHIEHSLSPMGVIGFYTFMYSQGVTSNVLSMYMKNPRFHHMIPYLGMTVGVFMQSYLSQILMDPNVRMCAKVWMGGQVSEANKAMGVGENPCDKAYEYLVVNKKIWEFAPGIVSMLISSGMAAGLQSLATKAVLRITSVDLAVYLMPGTMQLKGARLLLVKGLQIGVFAGLDVWINRKVTYVWKNMFDGQEFHDLENQLNNEIKTSVSLNWNDPEEKLEKQLKTFREKMTIWRMTNMAEVYESHQYWSDNVQEVTGLYNASYSFYSAFTTELRNSRFKETEYRPLEYSNPFNGVTSLGINPGNEDLYYTHPGFMKGGQLETVKEAAAQLASLISSETSLYPAEKRNLNEALALLNSTDEMKMGQGIQKLLNFEKEAVASTTSSVRYYEIIKTVITKLGKPYPTFGAGQGWAESYRNAPTNIQEFKGLRFARQVGPMHTPSITDYFVMQMLCGADPKTEALVTRPIVGFKDSFRPPALVAKNQRPQLCADTGVEAGNNDAIYQQRIQDTKGTAHRGAIPYIIENAVAEAIGNRDTNNFGDWWTQTTEPHMQRRFETYSKDYEKIVVNMVKSINNSSKNIFNGRSPFFSVGIWNLLKTEEQTEKRKRFLEGGPVHNGALLSASQELQTYLAVLESSIQPGASLEVDLTRILSFSPRNAKVKAVQSEFNKLVSLIKGIQIVKSADGREVIKSELENAQYEAPIEAIQNALTELSTELGVGEDSETSSIPEHKRNLLVTTMEQIQSLATEVMMFGVMANAASWDKLRNAKTVSAQQAQSQSEAEARVRESRGMRMGK